MNKLLSILFLSFILSGELEVEGNLTVTEGVNASSFAGDGSGLTNLPALGDMKPERIYKFHGTTFSFNVPEGKIWFVNGNSNTTIHIKISRHLFF